MLDILRYQWIWPSGLIIQWRHNQGNKNKSNRTKQCDQNHTYFIYKLVTLFKAHLGFVEQVFWHKIKVNITQAMVLNMGFNAMHPTKNPMSATLYRETLYCGQVLDTEF